MVLHISIHSAADDSTIDLTWAPDRAFELDGEESVAWNKNATWVSCDEGHAFDTTVSQQAGVLPLGGLSSDASSLLQSAASLLHTSQSEGPAAVFPTTQQSIPRVSATTGRRRRSERYLDDESMASSDDLFTVFHRNKLNKPTGDLVHEHDFGASCPEFGFTADFDNFSFSEENTTTGPSSDDTFEWSPKPTKSRKSKSWSLPDFDDPIPISPESIKNARNIVYPAQERRAIAAGLNKKDCFHRLFVNTNVLGSETSSRLRPRPEAIEMAPRAAVEVVLPVLPSSDVAAATNHTGGGYQRLVLPTKKQENENNLQLPPAFARMSSTSWRKCSKIPSHELQPLRSSTALNSAVSSKPIRGGILRSITAMTVNDDKNNKEQSSQLLRSGKAEKRRAKRYNHEPAWLLRLKWNAQENNKSKNGRATSPEDDDATAASSEVDWPEDMPSTHTHTRPDLFLNGDTAPLIASANHSNSCRRSSSLKWTREESSNESDWTLVVVTGWSESDDVETYYVHKRVLGTGGRESSFFRKEFTETMDGTSYSIVELDRLGADCVPDLLDFMYSAEEQKPLRIETSTAASVRHLGKYFGVKSMARDADLFIEKDLQKVNAHQYFMDARKYNNDDLLKAALCVLAKTGSAVKWKVVA